MLSGCACGCASARISCNTPTASAARSTILSATGGKAALTGSTKPTPRPMVRVEYEGTGLIPKEGLYNTVMNWNVRCRYANGLSMTFTTGSDSTTFHGTEGWLRICRNRIESEPASLAAAALEVSRFGVMGRNHTRNFLDSIRGQATPESPIDCAVRTGRKIRWDPAKETIVGDAEAARMLDRPLRRPWKL